MAGTIAALPASPAPFMSAIRIRSARAIRVATGMRSYFSGFSFPTSSNSAFQDSGFRSNFLFT
jgi:hypothetical protein